MPRLGLLFVFVFGLLVPVSGQAPVPMPSVQVDGRVDDLTCSQGVFYAVGRFLRARPAGEVRGGPLEVARTGALSFDAATGGMGSWSPDIQHSLYPIRVDCIEVSRDGETLYLGGVFNSVNGQRRVNLAAVDRQGQLLAWQPSDLSVGRVRDLALSRDGRRLFVAGHRGIQAYATEPGPQASDPSFAPRILDAQGQPAQVWALALSPDDQTLYFGGNGRMETVEGVPRVGAAAVDATTGAVTAFAPALRDTNPGDARVEIWEIRVRDGWVHLMGDWWQTLVDGVWLGDAAQQRNFGRFDPRTGAADAAMLPWSNGGYHAGDVDVVAGRLLLGGHFDYAGGSADATSSVPWRPDLVAFDTDGSNRAEAWGPRVLLGPGSGTSEVYAMELAAGVLAVGGEFDSVGGTDRDNLAVFRVSDRQALFVCSDPNALLPADAQIVARLEQTLGFAITLQDDDVGDGSEADGMDLVVISNTASWSAVRDRYRFAAAPLITWSAALLGHLGLTRGWWNVDSGVEYLDRIEPARTHPLLEGFDLESRLFSKPLPVVWGRPVPAAEVVALTPGAGLPCWFVLHGGDALWDGTPAAGMRIVIPGRREYGLSLPLLEPGFDDVFDASVRYAVGRSGEAMRRVTGGCSVRLQPQLRLEGLPRAGRSMEIDAVMGDPGRSIVLAVDASGAAPQTVSLGCDLVVDVAQAALYPAVLDATGTASWSLPVGSALHQASGPVMLQAVILNDGGPFGGSSLTDGFRILVQP